MKLLEKQIQKACLDYLNLKGYCAWRNQTTGTFNKKSGGYIPSPAVGAPDIIICHQGRFIGLEVKQPGKPLSDAQRAFQARIRGAGGRYEVITSVDDIIKLGL